MKKLAITVLVATTALSTGAIANSKFEGPWVGAAIGVGTSRGDLDFGGPLGTGKTDANTSGFIGGIHAG